MTEVERTAFDRFQVKALWVSLEPIDRLILVRVMPLDERIIAAGFIEGAEPDGAGMPTELRLGPEGSVRFGGGPMPEGWRAWSSGALVPGVGCYAFQIETARATDAIVFEVVE